MDFNFKKPMHIFALLLFCVSFLIIFGSSLFTLFSAVETPTIPDEYKLIVNIIAVIAQFFVFIIFMILVPVIWYLLVNDLGIKQIKEKLLLSFKNIRVSVFWGFLAFLIIGGLNIYLSLAFQAIGFNASELDNVQDIANLLLPVPMFLIVVFQPIGEEIFFRGFLLDKFDNFFQGKTKKSSLLTDYKIPAVLVTSFLFGIAHLSYGKLPIFVITFALGIVLGFVVVKTKSLYSSIVAHMLINISALIIYFFFQDLAGI